jgi:hypothetical protein
MTMPTHEAAAVRPQTTWTVSLSQANLRLLTACVNWLLQAQCEPEIREQLTSLRLQLERARPVGPDQAGHQAEGGRV